MRAIGWIVATLLCCVVLTGMAYGDEASSAPQAMDRATIAVDTLQLDAPGVGTTPLRVRVFLPPDYRSNIAVGYPVLYVNDGQDMAAVGMQATLERLYAQDVIRPLIVVAIDMPADRMGAYGLSDRAARHGLVAQTRYGPVGAQAHAYSDWVARTLVPLVDARYRTRPSADARAMLGWSLGALNAFNLGWQYPELFARVGAFSPSLWLSADRVDTDSVQRTRLAQRMVDGSQPRPGLKLFFAVGTVEETDDRDGDGINDALDDTRDLLDGWRTGDKVIAKGLRQLGYPVNMDHAARATRDDVALYVLDGGQHNQASWARMLPAFLRWAYARRAPALAATGRVDSYQEVASAHVSARNVDVWLPPGYAEHPQKRYPVLYMHDGQNLFDPKLSYTGVDWGIDETMTRLIAEAKVREAIIVGIWNTPRRFAEYMPQKAVTTPYVETGVGLPPIPRNTVISNDYLKFLVTELKPFIDATYRTLPDRDNTFVMGSSMGGLISLYAIAEYPEVFGGAAGVSTHWPAGDGIVIDWLAHHLPDRRTHRIYYDHGTATLDAAYLPFQQRMDAVMRAGGYVEGRNWVTRRFEGAEHNERAWRERVDVPLEFLLGQ
ncbi:MAG TPA: alpha/beta hydrolase-fold protein [Luteimonas sp.]|nr:alpha/beta hydrolase-fold protein [Luteimonas sp.]